MTSTLRSTLAASIALGLVSFTLSASVLLGVADPATVLGFGLLAAYGVVEIAIAAYRAPHEVRTARRVSVVRAQPRAAGGALIAFAGPVPAPLARAA